MIKCKSMKCFKLTNQKCILHYQPLNKEDKWFKLKATKAFKDGNKYQKMDLQTMKIAKLI